VKHFSVIYIVLIVFVVSCSSERAIKEDSPKSASENIQQAKRIRKDLDTSWSIINFTKRKCRIYDLPEVAFSIAVPNNFELDFNHKPSSAIHIVRKENDVIVTEIAIGISAFDKKYSLKQEALWLAEFKELPEIKYNSDFSVEVHENLEILSRNRSFYIMRANNDSEKYPANTPLNSVGITYPTDDQWFGLAIAVSKYNINVHEPLTKEELKIINSIIFE
jgi:hypothetical protein